MSFQQFKQELSTWLTSLGAGQVSKEFFELIKNIGEARSKQEESAIIVKESQQLKQTLAQPIDNKVPCLGLDLSKTRFNFFGTQPLIILLNLSLLGLLLINVASLLICVLCW